VTRRLVLPEGFLSDGDHALPEDLAHYVRRVLRLKPQDELLLSDGAGQEADGIIVDHGRVLIRNTQAAPAPLGPELTLIQGVGKGDKMDAVVRQATELGVRHIVPVLCERSVAQHQNRGSRWRAIAEDAVRVSGRARRPVIEAVIPLSELWDRPRAEKSLCLMLDAPALMPSKLGSAEILIGPEGGLTAEELEKAQAGGFSLVHLGPHTLRTETAGPAVLAVLMYGSGGFG
jgi:16S rRNA (uracil1498-N3)-methyltransferase